MVIVNEWHSASGKKKNIGDMMVLETIPSSQERIKAVIISSSAGMKHLLSQMDNTKNQLLSISMVASTGKQQGPAHEEKKHNFFSHSEVMLNSLLTTLFHD